MKILYPPHCLVCDGILGQEETIHKECKTRLYPIGEPVCMYCGKPMETERVEYCYDCTRRMKLNRKQRNIIHQGKALYLYKGGMKQAMYRFKYSNRRDYAEYFGEEAAACYGQWLKRNEIEAIVPVPMFAKKKRKRGYNQAEIFARELSLHTGIPVEDKWVIRVKDTRPQKELNDLERKNNLKGAFQTHEIGVKYKKILVVDDIYTTGSTIEAVTEAVSRTGVQCVCFLCICIGKGC